MLGTPVETAEGAMAAMMDPKNQSDAKIMAPSLSIWAGNSNFPNTAATKEMVPDWAEEKFDGTGHFVMMEQPERFNASLRAFLETRAKY
jgi:pimeloyl-ACP methyl ester carboxylesterase